MARIHITQCLCSNRHAIIAFAWEEPDQTPESAIDKIKEVISHAVEQKILNPWCAICDSYDFIYEDGITRFMSMEEAIPHIRDVEEENMAARRAFEAERN
jgi:hypothetical protein